MTTNFNLFIQDISLAISNQEILDKHTETINNLSFAEISETISILFENKKPNAFNEREVILDFIFNYSEFEEYERHLLLHNLFYFLQHFNAEDTESNTTLIKNYIDKLLSVFIKNFTLEEFNNLTKEIYETTLFNYLFQKQSIHWMVPIFLKNGFVIDSNVTQYMLKNNHQTDFIFSNLTFIHSIDKKLIDLDSILFNTIEKFSSLPANKDILDSTLIKDTLDFLIGIGANKNYIDESKSSIFNVIFRSHYSKEMKDILKEPSMLMVSTSNTVNLFSRTPLHYCTDISALSWWFSYQDIELGWLTKDTNGNTGFDLAFKYNKAEDVIDVFTDNFSFNLLTLVTTPISNKITDFLKTHSINKNIDTVSIDSFVSNSGIVNLEMLGGSSYEEAMRKVELFKKDIDILIKYPAKAPQDLEPESINKLIKSVLVNMDLENIDINFNDTSNSFLFKNFSIWFNEQDENFKGKISNIINEQLEDIIDSQKENINSTLEDADTEKTDDSKEEADDFQDIVKTKVHILLETILHIINEHNKEKINIDISTLTDLETIVVIYKYRRDYPSYIREPLGTYLKSLDGFGESKTKQDERTYKDHYLVSNQVDVLLNKLIPIKDIDTSDTSALYTDESWEKFTKYVKDNPSRALSEKAHAEFKSNPQLKHKKIASSSFLLENIKPLYDKFPHFSKVIEYIENHLLLQERGNKKLVIPPILMVGGPGTGKTFFSYELAKLANIYFYVFNMESMSSAWPITGLSEGWSSGTPGNIFNTLVNENCINPLFLLDEIDKATGSNQSDPSMCLLPLLEKYTAKHFKDECVPFAIDASNILWFATANNIDNISAPLRSRFDVFNIPDPNFNERKCLIKGVYEAVLKNNTWGHVFNQEVNPDTLNLLANISTAGAARDFRRILTEGCAKAIRDNMTDIIPKYFEHLVEKEQMPWDIRMEKE